MSHSSRRPSSQDSRRRRRRSSSSIVAHAVNLDQLSYAHPLALAGPNLPETPLSSASFEQSPAGPFALHGFPIPGAPPDYLVAAYSPPGAAALGKAELFVDDGQVAKFDSRDATTAENMMMAQRDLGYGYMPGPMSNPLQYGTSYSPLAPLPGYYEPQPPQQQQAQPPQPQHQHHRSYSGSSRPPSSHPMLDYASLSGAGSEVVDSGAAAAGDDGAASRKRRRTSQQHEARRQNKLRVRRNHQPSLPSLGSASAAAAAGMGASEQGLGSAGAGTGGHGHGHGGSNHLANASVDLYPAAASTPNSYVSAPHHHQHQHQPHSHHQHRATMPSTYRHDYADAASSYGYGLTSPVDDAADRVRHASYGSPPYQTTPSYSMGPLSSSALAPPLLGGTNYSPGRTSPLLQQPLQAPGGPSMHDSSNSLSGLGGMGASNMNTNLSAGSGSLGMGGSGGGRDKPRCWDHGCNGREFSTFSNLLRHQREKSGSAAKSYCPHCGAEFTRTTARNGHVEHGKCKNRKGSDASNPGAAL